jgi:hypothetical protein
MPHPQVPPEMLFSYASVAALWTVLSAVVPSEPVPVSGRFNSLATNPVCDGVHTPSAVLKFCISVYVGEPGVIV